MKIRKDFIIAIFVLFAIPAIGYFTLKKGADTRRQISASLQPKDSINTDYKIQFAENGEVDLTTRKLIDLPYIIKIISTRNDYLGDDEVLQILRIIDDRNDFAFLTYSDVPQVGDHERVYEFNPVNEEVDLSEYGDILMVDVYNRILQIYSYSDPELYKKILEDMSYAFPMVEYQIEQRKEK